MPVLRTKPWVSPVALCTAACRGQDLGGTGILGRGQDGVGRGGEASECPVSFQLGGSLAPAGHAQLLSHVWLFVTPWTMARQAPLPMGILQARILNPPPRDLPHPGIELVSYVSCIGKQVLSPCEPHPGSSFRGLALLCCMRILGLLCGQWQHWNR